MAGKTWLIVVALLLLELIVLLVLESYSPFFSDYLVEDTQSIECAFPPPDVDIPQMHAEIRQLILNDFEPGTLGAILMNGANGTTRYDTDVEQPFRQESNFLYVTGYDQPNATVLIDIASRKTMLFIEEQPEDYAIWNGVIETPEHVMETYDIEEVYFLAELPAIMSSLKGSSGSDYVIYVMEEFTYFPNKQDYTVNDMALQNIIYTRRSIKTDSELELMRYSSAVSSGAHEIVMNNTRAGIYEYNVEGTFIDGCFACGLTFQAYIPICASGNNSAILHYVANDRLLEDGDILLIDAGAEYNGYGSDITRTYPVNGEFTDAQAEVYNMVLDVQYKVINQVRPGIALYSLQDYAIEFICEDLIAHNFLTSTESECINQKLYYYFYPHSVSHYLGLDVHDRSGISPYLVERNVITVEPGIYFNNALLEPVLKSPTLSQYFNAAKIQPLLDSEFGGVRIEDVVVVWEADPEILSFPPKTIPGVELQMST